jgi:hypothetical protein
MELALAIILLAYIYVCTKYLEKKLNIMDKTIEMFRPIRTVKGFELVFISRIHKEGYGIEVVSNHKMQDMYSTDNFNLSCLSISQGTYIASGMATFVVKIKTK